MSLIVASSSTTPPLLASTKRAPPLQTSGRASPYACSAAPPRRPGAPRRMTSFCGDSSANTYALACTTSASHLSSDKTMLVAVPMERTMASIGRSSSTWSKRTPLPPLPSKDEILSRDPSDGSIYNWCLVRIVSSPSIYMAYTRSESQLFGSSPKHPSAAHHRHFELEHNIQLVFVPLLVAPIPN
ncbi:hypothetical protein P7C73_g1476, partial [Tremellales sp. Uapishka_1]